MTNELKQYIDGYDAYRESNGLTDELIDAYVKAISVCLLTEKDVDNGLKLAERVKGYICDACLEKTGGTIWQLEDYAQQNKMKINLIDSFYSICLMESFWKFESYMFYLEKDREQAKRFYFPRKDVLHTITEDLEDLANRKIKFLGVSLPSRTGKSTICIMFLTWLACKRPNSHSAMGGHSGLLAKGFYKELMNIFSNAEYRFADIYDFWNPQTTMIQDKSAEDFTITLDKPDRFATISCRGVDGTWTGAIDISYDGVLYVDDMVRDREHSLSPQRMENTYQEYLNKMVDRKSGIDLHDGTFAGSAELMVGTLWNVYDPLYRMRLAHENDPLYRFRRIPALNDNDETNFPYQYSTEYLLDMRNKLDDAEWMAKWQQQPYVREGLLFKKDEMNYFSGLMPEEQHSMICILDPAVGGGDYLSMPIIWDGHRRYVVDWIYNKGTQKVTVPLIVDKIIYHRITELHFEKNGVGRLFENEIKQELERRGCNHCRILSYSAPTGMSKEDKIRGYSDWVKDKLWFIDENAVGGEGCYTRSMEYEQAMSALFMYTAVGKNEHDDSADSLAQVARVFEKNGNGTVDIIRNPFGR